MDNGSKNRSCVELGEEIIEEEILTRVSVKSALRLRCVSKSWRFLIDSRRFIKKHLQNSSRLQRVVFNCCFEEWTTFVRCSRFYLGGNKLSDCPIDDPPHTGDSPHHPLRAGILLGHCNGLLCVFEPFDTSCFFLWNPAIRVSVKLPKIDHDSDKNIKYGFGWDEHSGSYKVFVSDDESTAQVYSSNTNSWTRVERGRDSLMKGDSLIKGFGVFAYGKIHWITTSGQIESFDLKGDVFEKTMINQPCKPGEGVCLWLWEWRGRLYVVCDIAKDGGRRRRAWLMNENKNENGKGNENENGKGNEKEEFYWIEDKQVPPLLDMDTSVSGSYGAFSYIQTLVSPPFVENK